MFLEDGKGSGYKAQVTKEQKLAVDAINTTHLAHESKDDGEAFVIATDFISLTTTGSFNGLLYFKCTTSDQNFHIEKIRICSSGTGYMQIEVTKNPTTGTLISDANAALTNPLNFGSSKVINGRADVYSASGDGKTVTDGDKLTQYINKSPGHSHQDYEGSLILHNGDSIAITCKPSIATDICLELLGYFE